MQVHNFWESFNYALEGLVHTLKTQRNMKIHFAIAFLILIGSLFLDITKTDLILLFLAISFVIAMEMVNTAVEVVIDMICERYSYRARMAKNIAAGAVLIAAINAIFVGYLIFLDDLNHVSLQLINHIKHHPFHLTFINLCLLFMIVVAVKSSSKKGTPLRGGMPSGHSAIAFSITTIIVFLSGNILIASLVLILALLVIQSRLQNGTHTLMEVVTGALIGILLTLIIFQFL